MTSHKKSIECLGLGIMPLDLLCAVPRFPDIGGKIDATGIDIRGGGPVPNVMVGLARLGYQTAIIAGIGTDLFGKQMTHELRAAGVDHRYLVTIPGQSEMAVGYVEAGSGRRTIVLHRSAYIRPEAIQSDRLPKTTVIHLDGRDLAACMKLARWGKRHGAIISFDIGSVRNDVTPLLPLVDHLVVADSFAFPCTRTRTAEQAIRRLKRSCPGTIVVTCGTNGSYGCERGMHCFQPAFRVPVADTTGAGDAYHTGYLHGLLTGTALAERMRLGSAVAALKVQAIGARGGLPDRSALARFLAGRRPIYA